MIIRAPLSSTGRTVVPAEHTPRPLRASIGSAAAPETEVTPEPALGADQDPVNTVAPEVRQAIQSGFDEGFAAGHRDGFEQGVEEGRQRGYEAGEQAASANAQERLDDLVRRIGSLARELEEARDGLLHAAQDDVACAVFEAFCKLVGDHLVTRSGVVAQVQAVIDRVVERRGVRIRVHPTDLTLIQQSGAISLAGGSIEWTADSTLAHGGSIVETATGEFRARLDDQLRTVLTVLCKARERAAFVWDHLDVTVPTAPDIPAVMRDVPAPPRVQSVGGSSATSVGETTDVSEDSTPPAPRPFTMKWGTV